MQTDMARSNDRNHWLLDLCGFYKGEETDPYAAELARYEVDKSHLPPPECMKTEYRGLSVQEENDLRDSSFFWGYEQCWVDFMSHGRVDPAMIEEARYYCPRSLAVDDGVPVWYKAILMNRIQHWTDRWPDDEHFMRVTMGNYYRLRHNPNKVRKGRRILNQMRLEYISWHSYHDWLEKMNWKVNGIMDRQRLEMYRKPSEDMRRRFDIVEAASGEARRLKGGRECIRPVHCAGGVSRIERMLERAEANGLTVVILEDYCTPSPVSDTALYVHPEYKEARELLFRKQGWREGSKEALTTAYVGRYEGRYVYKRDFSSDGQKLVGAMTCIFDGESLEYSHVDAYFVRKKAYKNP